MPSVLRKYAAGAMLDRDVQFEGFDADDWTRLVELMRADPGTEPDAASDAGLIVIHDAGRVIKAYRTAGDASTLPGERWPQPLPELASRESVRWVLSAETGGLDAWATGMARRVERSQDMLDQLLMAWQEARNVAAEGRLETWPTALTAIPVPSRAVLMGAVGLFCPTRQTLVVAAWDAGRLWTSLALHRSDQCFDRLVGPDELRAEVEAAGPDAGAMWTKLTAQIRARLGPVGFGMAADRTTWAQLAMARGPGAWAQVVASGQVVIDPFPPGLALPLAVDASRMALATLRTALGRRLGPARPVGGRATPGSPDFASLWRVAEGLWSLSRRGRG